MADQKISQLGADATPTSDDITVTVDIGTGVTKKATLTNVITKAHGLNAGLPTVKTGVLASNQNYAINNVTAAAPTKAELTTSFGTPAAVGAGFLGVVNDNNDSVAEILVFSDGAEFWYILGATKAI